MENRRRSRSNSQSDTIRRGRGRPKTVGLKKQEEEKGELASDVPYILTKKRNKRIFSDYCRLELKWLCMNVGFYIFTMFLTKLSIPVEVSLSRPVSRFLSHSVSPTVHGVLYWHGCFNNVAKTDDLESL